MIRIDVLIPAHNEEKKLAQNIAILHDFLSRSQLPYHWRILIGDNGSTDSTAQEARRLAEIYPGEVEHLRIEGKGKGLAVKHFWLESSADIVSFMDADLSTDLEAFPLLIKAVIEDGYDIAVGSRLKTEAKVMRGFQRRMLTRGYNILVKAMFFTGFSDAQCGFKAMKRESARSILPLIKDEKWFFDTELLILAEKLGYRIHDLPVIWVEDTRTSVKVAHTVMQVLAGLLRMRLTRPWRNLSRRA